jgi:hypothetical protein
MSFYKTELRRQSPVWQRRRDRDLWEEERIFAKVLHNDRALKTTTTTTTIKPNYKNQ